MNAREIAPKANVGGQLVQFAADRESWTGDWQKGEAVAIGLDWVRNEEGFLKKGLQHSDARAGYGPMT